MLRKLLGVVVALALPSLLAGQAPRTPGATATRAAAPSRGIAVHVLGDVVAAEELQGPSHQQRVDDADGDNDQEDVDEADGPNHHNDVDQDDVNEPDDVNDVDGGDKVDQGKDDEDDDAPAAPQAGTGRLSRIGRHKP